MSDSLSWRLSEDRKTLIAEMDGTPPRRVEFDAAEADKLIKTITGIRMWQEPTIPMRDPAPGETMPILPKGRWWVQPDLMTGGIVLALLHPGYGWVGLQMEQQDSSQLIQRILQQRPSAGPSAKEKSN